MPLALGRIREKKAFIIHVITSHHSSWQQSDLATPSHHKNGSRPGDTRRPPRLLSPQATARLLELLGSMRSAARWCTSPSRAARMRWGP